MTNVNACTIADALKQTSTLLEPVSDTPRLDAELLLGFILEQNRTWLYARPEQVLNDAEQARFETISRQRFEGMPVAYITGYQEFWSLKLAVNESVLIPRPDTELLVEQTLALLHGKSSARVLELGTGSGAIALALASELPDLEILATDRSKSALLTASANGSRLNISSITWCESNWFVNVPNTHFDIVVSNPPYIEKNDKHLKQQGIRFEPESALISGTDGLDDIRVITQQAADFLVDGGWLLLEHGFEQGAPVRDLFDVNGYNNVRTGTDAAARERVTLGRTSA